MKAGTAWLSAGLCAASMLASSGCTPPPVDPVAELSVYLDVSGTNSVTNSEPAVDQAIAAIAALTPTMHEGDRLSFAVIGDATLANDGMQKEIRTGWAKRLSSIGPEVDKTVRDMITEFSQRSGDDQTNIIATVSNNPPDCTSSRSAVLIVSDSMENGQLYSAQHALANGQEIELPPPTEKIFTGCKTIKWLGLGKSIFNPATGRDEMLDQSQIEKLRIAWTAWLIDAGAAPGAIEFI
jgi:hypothetical protein